MRFVVKERRMYDVTYVVDADSEDAAKRLDGTIVQEEGDSLNSWGYDFLDFEQVDEDFEL